MAQPQTLQRSLASIDVSDPHLYQNDTWRPLFAQLRRDDPVHYCEASAFGPYVFIGRGANYAYTLTSAGSDVIDQYARFSLPRHWGSGRAAIADGTHVKLRENNLLGSRHIQRGPPLIHTGSLQRPV